MQIRRPSIESRNDESMALLLAMFAVNLGCQNAPLLTRICPFDKEEWVHSNTLPDISMIPKGDIESGYVPTMSGPADFPSCPYVSSKLASCGSSRLPCGKSLLSAPRAARSHSCSVQKRAPYSFPAEDNQSMNICASYALIPPRGNFFQSAWEWVFLFL